MTDSSSKAMCNSESDDPEMEMLRLVKDGFLDKVGKNAISASHAAGISPVIMIGDKLFRLHPDGSKTLYTEEPGPISGNDQTTTSVAPVKYIVSSATQMQ